MIYELFDHEIIGGASNENAGLFIVLIISIFRGDRYQVHPPLYREDKGGIKGVTVMDCGLRQE